MATGGISRKFMIHASSVSGATWQLFIAFRQSRTPNDRYIYWCACRENTKAADRGLILDATSYGLGDVRLARERKVGSELLTDTTSWSEGSTILSNSDVRLECHEADGVLRLSGRLLNSSFAVTAQVGVCDDPDAASTNADAMGWLCFDEEKVQLTRLDVLRTVATDCLGDGGTWIYLPSAGRWIEAAGENGARICRSNSTWQSGRTFECYELNLELEGENTKLIVRALNENQRGEVLIGQSPKWIGFCSVLGMLEGRPVNETGLLKTSGQSDQSVFTNLIQRANRCTIQAYERILPACAELNTLFDEAEIEELGLARLSGDDLISLVQPIRSILTRGGKGWRGCALALCCEAVGGDFSGFRDWLAFSEILHVGSLIVDDVEDGSVLRRGGAACHMTYGVPIAVNAGSLAYFVVQRIIDRSDVSSRTRSRLYKEYFDLLRIAHVGQGLDLALGVQKQTPEFLASTSALNQLESEIRRAHRLKSGVPFRAFARMGAMLGEGDAAEIDALGRFFLRIGTAFQLLDDVLNIEGFDGNLKLQGEDIARGKLTLPIVRAMQIMSDRERKNFIRDWIGCEGDPAQVYDIVGRVRKTGAVRESRNAIRLEQIASWAELNEVLANSTAKAMLKVFSERVLKTFY